jgi:hypothetical protein
MNQVRIAVRVAIIQSHMARRAPLPPHIVSDIEFSARLDMILRLERTPRR